MQHSVEALASSFDVTVVGPEGCSEFAPKGVTTIECPATPFLFLVTALIKGLLALRRASFDIVLGGSGLVAPVTSIVSMAAKARSVVFVHGLDLVVDNFVYQRIFVPFIRRHNRVIANSQNTRKIAIEKGCQSGRIEVVHPGSTIPPEFPEADIDSFRTQLGLEGRKIVLSVGRMIRRKGLAEFLENSWPRIVDQLPEATLVVVGDSPDDAVLKDPEGAKRLLKAIDTCGENTVRFLGAVEDDVLWKCYAAADVLVFPLIRVKGDVEGFGMVAIEAAACGTATVAFPVGGVVDAVSDGTNGTLAPEGDYEAFADAVVTICNGAPPGYASCRNHALQFSWEVHRQKLLSALQTDAPA